MQQLKFIILFFLLLFYMNAMAKVVEVEKISPEDFFGFINHIQSKKIEADTPENAESKLKKELSIWAIKNGFQVKKTDFELTSNEKNSNIYFFSIHLNKYKRLKIKKIKWIFSDNRNAYIFKLNYTSPPDLEGYTFNLTTINNSISNYIRKLKYMGFVFAKAHISYMKVKQDGFTVHVSATLSERYKFYFEKNKFSNDAILRNALLNNLQFFSKEEVLKILNKHYNARGFKNANIVIKQMYTAPELKTTVVKIRIDEGHQYRFGSPIFKIEDNQKEEIYSSFDEFFNEEKTGYLYSREGLLRFLSFFKEWVKRLGYYQAEITLKNTSLIEGGHVMIPEFYVLLGTKTILSRATIKGIPDSLAASVNSIFEPLAGYPLDKIQIQKSLDHLSESLSNLGYHYSKSDLKIETKHENIETKKRFVSFNITISLGPQVILSDYRLENLCGTSEKYLKYIARLQTKIPLDPRTVQESISALYSTDLFRNIETNHVDIKDKRTIKRSLSFKFQCAERGLHELGVGYFTDTGVKLFYNLTYTNLFGSNEKLFFGGNTNIKPPPSLDITKSEAFTGLFWPYFAHLPFDLHAKIHLLKQQEKSLNKSENKEEKHDFTRVKVLFDFEKTLTPWFTVIWHLYELDLDRVDNFSNAPDRKEEFVEGLTGLSLHFDFRNDKHAPTEGHAHLTTVSLASEYLGSSENINYVLAISKHVLYISPPKQKNIILAVEAFLGWMDTIGNSSFIPESRFFFLGGDNSIRGFSQKGIGPNSSVNAKDVNNMTLVSLRTELRFLIYGPIYFFWFWDTGQIRLNNKALDPFRHSLGVGLRIQTPLGGINLALGFPVDDLGAPSNQADISAFKVHLSLSLF